MNNSQVAHIWANQSKARATGSNFYFDGPVIYSYGEHFPIARFVDDKTVLFTTRRYGQATSKHIAYAYRALTGLDLNVLHVDNVCPECPTDHEDNIIGQLKVAHELVSSSSRRRIREYAWSDLGKADTELEEVTNYRKYYLKALDKPVARKLNKQLKNLRESIDLAKQQLADKNLLSMSEYDKKSTERKIKNAKKRVEEWKQGGRNRNDLHALPVSLRVSGDRVQTSHGAEVPLKAAVSLWKALQRNIDVVGCPIGFFKISSVTDEFLQVGCHTIPRTELQRIAEQLEIV